MDLGTISLVLLFGLLALLAIGMPLGMASAILAVLTLVMKFEPQLLTAPWTFGDGMLTGRPGTGPLNVLSQKIYGLLTDYVLISVPLFIFMAALLERSGVAKDMYSSLSVWLSRARGGIAIVTSIMAVIMAAMSGIIGGEVVLLGLIALPQMLRLGYDQNLAIGTICASGSLGTMIPPSIVLIIFGLVTETSIKSLFTAAFLPGFMLASFIIIYIVIRTQLNPSLAPLPEDPEDYSHHGTSTIGQIVFGLAAAAAVVLLGLAVFGPVEDPEAGRSLFVPILLVVIGILAVWLSLNPKGQLFLAFLTVLAAGFSFCLMLRALFFTVVTGENGGFAALSDYGLLGSGMRAALPPDQWIGAGMPHHVIIFGIATLVGLAVIFFALGRDRTATGWDMGKGLVAPIVVIGVVMGSIYGGITGITEAAGMGALAVLIIAFFRGEGSLELVWDSLMRTLRSTGTIIWVTIGAAALAGAYTIAGGPTYVANAIVGADLPTMGILLVMMVILLFMGAFMDWVGIVLLIIPVFLPIVQRLPIEEIGLIGDPLQAKYLGVWFGVLFCMNMQVSFLSPPFGPAAFYLKSVAPPHISLTDIFRGFLPFICIQICALSVLLIWPPIIEVLLPKGCPACFSARNQGRRPPRIDGPTRGPAIWLPHALSSERRRDTKIKCAEPPSDRRSWARPMRGSGSKSRVCSSGAAGDGFAHRCARLGRRVFLRRLPMPKMRVTTVLHQQRLVRALFDDFAGLKHHDPIRIRDRGKPVRNGQHGAPLAHRPKLGLDRNLGIGVER